MNTEQTTHFSSLISDPKLLKALEMAGYEEPTPIQQQMIPHLAEGRDVIGQAQTGTGKTAAFALPIIEKLELKKKQAPQALIIAPTRELALQVTEAFEKYGKFLPRLRFLAIFGGQDYSIQLRKLKNQPQVVIGTPGRVMDHIRKGTLVLDNIKTLVLDEADEMLNMGFIEDIEWILQELPEDIQTALFSATMPGSIRKIAQKYLTKPIEIKIENKSATASTIDQRFLISSGYQRKTDALMRILDTEITDGVLIFVRTKVQTMELAEKLIENGYLCSPLNGDMPQNQRIRAVEQLKKGQINLLIATDVAARGLDVDRVSHVINFDIPFDVESYIHRVGRTGRAGRQGQAILFVNPREKRMLKTISRVTKSEIKEMALPTEAEIEEKRIELFVQKIKQQMDDEPTWDHWDYKNLAQTLVQDETIDQLELIAILTKMAAAPAGLFIPRKKGGKNTVSSIKEKRKKKREKQVSKPHPVSLPEDEGMERYRLEAGHNNEVKPANIVGAIANEADISSEYIGRISIFDDYSFVDLPYGMPRDILRKLQRARINGVMMKLKRHLPSGPSDRAQNEGKGKTKSLKFKNKSKLNRSKRKNKK